MNRLNVIGLDTPHGYRTVELLQGDIAQLDFQADILVVSAFRGDYSPLHGTVLGALKVAHGMDVKALSGRPEYDLRTPLCIWISTGLDAGPAHRLMCVEMIGTGLPTADVLVNVFAGLALADAKGIPIRLVAMPLIGTGNQRMDPKEIASLLVPRAESYLQRSYGAESLYFVELDADRAQLIADAMDAFLGRSRVVLPQEQLVGYLREDIRNFFLRAKTRFSSRSDHLYNEWIQLLQAPAVRSSEFGVASRKLVEFILADLDVPDQPLYKRIRALEERGDVAPWVCGYMHLLRHFGNESAHENQRGSGRRPPVIAPPDLTAGLFCVERLLEFWLNE